LKGWPELQTIVKNIKIVLLLIEIIEHFKDLSIYEWNFRSIISAKLISLLKQ